MEVTVQYDTHTLKTTSVLHVEDNRVDAMILRKMLENNGKYVFSFTSADTLMSAMDVLKNEFFDIILLDLTLPDSSGLKTLEFVHQQYSELPIIILTGSDDETTGIDAIRRGAQDYLIKGHLKLEIIMRMIFSAIDRKKAEQALIASHERITLTTLGTSDGYWDWQLKENTFHFSDRFYQLVEHTKSSLPANYESFLGLVHSDDKDNFLNAIELHKKESKPLHFECRLKLRSDKYRWFLLRGKAVRDDSGVCNRISGSIVDIDSQKSAEAALKESEERLKFALEGSSDGFWDWNIPTGMLYFSPRLEAMLGYEKGTLNPHMGSWQKRISPDDIESVIDGLNDHLERKTAVYQGSHRIKTKTGQWIWVRGRGKIVEWDKQGQPIRMVGAYTDITQEKIAHEENSKMALRLQQASKLESIGRLAAGVAHEINTPTQFVGDNIWFLKDECRKILPLMQETYAFIKTLEKNAATTEKIEQLETAWQTADVEYLASEIPMAITQSLEGIERISTIVKAMKEFSHPGTGKKEFIDINKLIENILIVSRNEWKLVANLNTNLANDLPLIECYPGELNQSLLNFIVNAAQAIDAKTKPNDTSHGLINISTEHQSNKLIIKIKDSGIGMTADVKSKVFEPFYTTKEIGKGTGQGLAIAHSVIADRHQGHIDIESKIDEGTTFTITLPIKNSLSNNNQEDEKIRSICG